MTKPSKPPKPEPDESLDLFVRVTPELGRRIRAAAAADSRSVSAWIRLALEQKLKEGK